RIGQWGGYSKARKRWTKRAHEDTLHTCGVAADGDASDQYVVAGPDKCARAQSRRLRVHIRINIVDFRQPYAGGHCLALEKCGVGPGRESNQNRRFEIIRWGQPRRLKLRFLCVLPIVVSCDK